MLIYEYEAKELFRKYHLPLLNSTIAENSTQAYHAAEKFGGKCVLKAQILGGGRGKRGLIKMVLNSNDAKDIAQELLVRKDLKEGPVHRLLIEELADIKQEFYLGALIDRTKKSILVMVSTQGGVDIEAVSHENPEAIGKIWLPFSSFAFPYLFFPTLDKLKLQGKQKIIIASMLSKIVNILRQEDLMLLEINPFAFSSDNNPLVLDARVLIDPSALYRHEDQAKFASLHERYSLYEIQAKNNDLSYVQLDGNVGMISCGAGLSMATCDMLANIGGKPANFLDVGGGASPEKVESALNILFDQLEVKGVLINVFGGITRCDQVAEGIINALDRTPNHVPIVVRLIGTNDKEGVKLLSEYGIAAYVDMEPAIQKIMEVLA